MRILMACGGTGGHIFPAFSLTEELRKRDAQTQIGYVCGRKDIEHAIFKIIAGEKIFPVDSAPFRGIRSIFDPLFLLKLSQGFFQSVAVLKKEKPDVVVGFGGYFSFPVVAMARCLGIKTIVHEQNVIPGIANRVLGKWTDGFALSFSESRHHLDGFKNLCVTGNPIRSSIEKMARKEALGYFNFSQDKFTVLVLGGSQGAESINKHFLELLPQLPEAVRSRIQILHLSGKMPAASSERQFEANNLVGRSYSFFDRMDLAYAASDFAIGRAGATFLAEAAAIGLPVILVPYPHGNGHQSVNARVFASEHNAIVIEQKDLTTENLKENLLKILNRVEEQKKSFLPKFSVSNARARLADFIEEIYKK